jgi:hypothetical protein
MVEYGGGIAHGPAGQVGGSSGAGTPGVGAHVDFFGSIGHAINDVTNTVLAQPPEILAIGIVLFFLGLIVLRRAF